MAAGCAVQAAVGIGLALLVVPLLALVDPGFVPGPMLLAGTVLAAMTAYRERGCIDAGNLRLSFVGLLFGTISGAIILTAASGPSLPKVIGGLVLLAVLISLVAPPIQPNRLTIPLAGAASGLMGTMAGIHGPPIALLFQNAEPGVARAMLGAIFAVAYAGSVVALAAAGLFGWPHLVRAMVLLPGVALGLIIAPSIRNHIDRARLRFAILAVSTISALALLLG